MKRNFFVTLVLGFAALVMATVAMAEQGPDKGGLAPTVPKPGSPEAGPTAPSKGAHALEAADVESWLDGVFPFALKTGDIAGAVVVVVKDGKVLVQKGYGYADVARKIPMDPDRTLIRPGSTSKLFTWTAVMQLVQQGKLDLDRNVNDYLDFKIPERFGKPITLRDLMNHRAGFEEGLKSVLSTDPNDAQSTEHYLKTHLRPELFPPGVAPAYSNYGAALAGYIVQRVSGEPYETYIDRHIFQPLGMRNSTFLQPLPESFRPNVSQGYRTASSQPSPYELIITRPAGSATMSASDMSRFMIAQLQQGRLGDAEILSPDTARLMQSPSEQPFMPGFATMAHGFFYETVNGRTAIGHGGDSIVFHTEMELLPKEGVGIFYTFNSRGAQDAVYAARDAVFHGFMDRYFPATPSPVAPPPPNPRRDAQAIAGGYESSRRIEHGFMSVFYLIQQSRITANADGSISAPDSLNRGQKTFREVAPQVWREVGGTRELALTHVGGVKTVVDSEDPITVLQATPPLRSSSLIIPVLLGSLAALVWTSILWPLSPLVRRGEPAQGVASAEVRRLRLFSRGAALLDIAYLLGWFTILQPVLNNKIEAYNDHLNGAVRLMQILGLPVIAAAVFGVWIVWRMFRAGASWPSRLWSIAVSLALLGVVWIAFIANFISFSLNY